ncbi:MAG TPA: MotA/TolQ/ExbB proton channel family protein [Paenalcaligenes sp.]|nr:MotA/TolQ/ExbB proton channel family protein [Paenalcaligenes sp.]
MYTLIEAAGWPIWLLLACSIVGLAIVLERLYQLRAARVAPRDARQFAQDLAQQNTPNIESLERLRQSPLGQLYAALIQERDQPAVKRDEITAEIGQSISFALNRFLPALGTIAVIAPLLGLFGTVIGMIELFGSYTPQGSDPDQFARGISIALYNTAFGIIIAIPALIFHRYFRSQANYFLHILEIESARFNRFIDFIHTRQSSLKQSSQPSNRAL